MLGRIYPVIKLVTLACQRNESWLTPDCVYPRMVDEELYTFMVAYKQYFVPAMVATFLLFLTIIIGILAFSFFDGLAQRTVQVEPFYAVSTGVVHRTAMPPGRSREDIILDEGEEVPVAIEGTDRIIVPDPPALAPSGPAVCMNYEDAITSRKAWANPLELAASTSPSLVTVHIIPSANSAGESE